MKNYLIAILISASIFSCDTKQNGDELDQTDSLTTTPSQTTTDLVIEDEMQNDQNLIFDEDINYETKLIHFNLNEMSGNSITDRGSLGLAATRTLASWYTDSEMGSSLRFNGLEGKVESAMGTVSALSELTEGSISLWFTYAGLQDEHPIAPIFFFGEDSLLNLFTVEVGHNAEGNEKLYFTFTKDGSLTLCFDSNENLIPGHTYHFVGVVGPTGNTGYLDGAEMTNRHYNFGTAATSNIFFSSIQNPQKMYLGYGTTNAGKSLSQWWYWRGSIGDFRIYTKPLTAEDVTNLYQSLTTP